MPEATLTLDGVETQPTSLRFTGAVWGFDLSTSRIALAVLDGRPDAPPELGWFSLDVQQLDKGPHRLRQLQDDLDPWLERIRSAAMPRLVAVEQPFGQGKARPQPQSYYVVAILLAKLARMLEHNAPVGVIEPTSWKKDALGEGNGFAKKGHVLRWAREHGYPGDCSKCHGLSFKDCDPSSAGDRKAHDEADAVGIATAAAVRLCGARSLR